MYEIKELHEDITKGMSLEAVHKKYGGFSIYVTQSAPDYKEKILNEFNGYNHPQLATKYNVALNTVYTIVREAKAKQRPALFDGKG